MFWTEDVLRGGETIHFAEMLLKFRSKQLKIFRKPLKLTRFTTPLPPQGLLLDSQTRGAS